MTETLYHGTRRSFDAFDDGQAGAREEGASNSALGIWFFSEASYLSHFDGQIIEAEVDLGRTFVMRIEEFHRRHSEAKRRSASREEECAIWRAWRADLLEQGFNSVAVQEIDGQVSIYVALTADRVLSMHDLAPAPAP